MYLNGGFRDRQSTIRAILDLKTGGFAPEDLDVFSEVPLELPRGVLDRPSRMSLAAVIGAITSCLLTIGFVYFTQYNYPLVTGGMPIFSFWATGVVFYELTMLGAILTTFFWFLRDAGLLRRRRNVPVPRVESGVISLRVRCGDDKADAARKVLEASGADRIERIGATP
jgi:Protein of unknown function (DUF3341)